MEVSALKPSAVPALRGPTGLLRLQSDERLIALVRRGHHAAFEVLVSRYQSRLLAFCRHMLGSREDAEDVLQEVFAAAFNAILADERAINVRPWLYRIARNRSLNHLRRASAVGVDSMDVHYAENGISTAEKVLRRESFRQLIGDVHKLPETQRTALLLREIDALSYEQIADTMETTVPAVKSLLVRARISLAEAAEARKLSCEEARLELGEAAEGLVKTSAAVRRHVRECERCRAFRKHLKDNNVALAALLPVGPFLLLKKLALTKLGSTAGAGGAHMAGAGGAGAAGAGAAGWASAGSLVTAGASALATKAAAGLAVAAIVTAGTVEAEHAATPRHRRHDSATTATAPSPYTAPQVTRSSAQPVTIALATAHPARSHPSAAPTKPASEKGEAVATPAVPPAVETPAAPASANPTSAGAETGENAVKTADGKSKSVAPVTQVTTETTQLTTTSATPESSTPPPPGAPAPEETGTSTTSTTPSSPPPPTTTEAPPPTPPTAPSAEDRASSSDRAPAESLPVGAGGAASDTPGSSAAGG
ncbi:MAG: sigma-70 family RNA polymerase sigma factor [Solirubrobacteraceae bacterium]